MTRLQDPPPSSDYPYRPPRIDDNLYQAQLPDLVAGEDGSNDAVPAALEDGRKRVRRPTRSEFSTLQSSILLRGRLVLLLLLYLLDAESALPCERIGSTKQCAAVQAAAH